MEETNKLFVNFLKDNNAFKQYVRYLKTERKRDFLTWENHTNPFTIIPLELCFNQARIEDIIARSFRWAGTPEGDIFWAYLSSKWREICRSHNTI